MSSRFNPDHFWSRAELSRALARGSRESAGALLIGLGLFYIWRQLSAMLTATLTYFRRVVLARAGISMSMN